MQQFTSYVTYAFSALTIVALFIALAATGAMLRQWKTGKFCVMGRLLSRFALPLSTLMAALAMTGSLFYSDIAHYTPCLLCWYQRIAMYPMVVIGFLAGVAKKKFSPDMIALSAIGAIIAAYHYLLQIGWIVSTRCEDLGYSVSCSERFSMTYGFVTIPMMAFGVFVAILALQLLARSAEKAPTQS